MRISDPKNITMGFDISELDIETYMREKRLRRGTIITRRSRIKIFLAWLKENNEDLSSRAIKAFFDYLQYERGLLGTSLNTYHIALLTLEEYVLDREIDSKFMDGIKRFSEEDPDIIPLTPEEVRALKNAWVDLHRDSSIDQTYFDVTINLCDTGMRWEDAQNLKVKSVDIIGQQLSYIQLKTGTRRTVHLEEPLLSIFKRRLKGRDLEDHVFTNSKGGTIYYSDYYTYLKALKNAAHITKVVSPHILRHSYAQNLYDQTGDIYLVKDVLGHKNIRSTLRYLHNSGKRVKQAQQMHPHLSDYVSPYIRIETVEKELEKTGLQEDERFDRLKVKEANILYIKALIAAVKPDLNLP